MSLPRQSDLICFLIAAGIILATSTGLAQTSAPASSEASRTFKLIPSLDKELMDTAADPCVDFYRYACGNWSKLHPIPNDSPYSDQFYNLEQYNRQVLHEILDSAAAGGGGRDSNTQKIGDYYASCMDQAFIQQKATAPLQPELERINALTSKDQLPELLAHFQLINVNAFLGFGSQQDFKDATREIAAVSQGGLGLPEKDYYLRTGEKDEEIRKQYVQHIGNILKLLGASDAQTSNDSQAIMKLETALAKVSLDVTSQRDPLGNSFHAAEFESHRQLAKIGKPVNRDEWEMSPPTVNAYYSTSMNDINFPAGVLQSPFFATLSADALNYGHIGLFMGHELTHGFDDEGRQFDGRGNLDDWWTKDDAEKFTEKADCFVHEYGQFSVGDTKLNGKLTLGENAADNGGMRLAYMAFLARAAEESLNLDKKTRTGYTPLQEVFVGFAQDWCAVWRPELERLIATTDPHSPDRFRANGVLVNMPEFAKAFGCKAGQPMVAVKACRVW